MSSSSSESSLDSVLESLSSDSESESGDDIEINENVETTLKQPGLNGNSMHVKKQLSWNDFDNPKANKTFRDGTPEKKKLLTQKSVESPTLGPPVTKEDHKRKI